MKRFVLRFSGPGVKPMADVQRIRALPGATVVDESSRMLLLEAPPASISQLAAALPNWTLSPETTTPILDPRPKLLNGLRYAQ